MPRASIIIVSYNGLNETTAPCLESLFKVTECQDFEVIVVDNNSSDGTAAYLDAFRHREPRLRTILNQSNRGFAGGNNDGIRIAHGDFLVLLNSDTLVTDGWLEGLLRPLSEDMSVGMTGPVSNNVGNEQRIFTSGITPDEIIREGLAWRGRSRDARFETDMLGFFCVALRRDVIEKVGLLDEDFGLGYFEDDDYCIRVRNAGYRMVCVEDVFVYHRGEASFGKMAGRTRLARKNRDRLKKKHPQGSERAHHPYGQMAVIGMYLDDAAGKGLSEDIRYRIGNRLRVIESYKPGNMIKKIKFYRLFRRLKSRLNTFGLDSQTMTR